MCLTSHPRPSKRNDDPTTRTHPFRKVASQAVHVQPKCVISTLTSHQPYRGRNVALNACAKVAQWQQAAHCAWMRGFSRLHTELDLTKRSFGTFSDWCSIGCILFVCLVVLLNIGGMELCIVRLTISCFGVSKVGEEGTHKIGQFRVFNF